MEKKIKSVGDGIDYDNASWSFGGKTALKFAKHARKSIPNYEDGHDLICKVSDFFLKNESICYELGTSVGELILKLASHHSTKPKIQFIGLDTEDKMIAEARGNNKKYKNVKFVVDDINTYEFAKSDLFLSYYTIQFIHPKLRQNVFNSIYNSLNWGGALILFEKVRASDARFQDIFNILYNDFKLDNNYTPDEIIAKTRSLKGVLEPFSTQANIDLMKRSGFSDIITIQKHLCFEGFLAIK